MIGGLCLNRKRAGRTASVRFEVAMQSVFQEKCSYTMAIPGAVWWRIGDGASDEGFNGCKSDAAFACSSMADLPGLSFRSGTQISMVGSIG